MNDVEPIDPAIIPKCECQFCKQHDRVEAVIESRDVDALITLVTELENALGNAEEDLDYSNVIINGTWPNADHIIERRRKEVNATSGKQTQEMR